MNNAIERRLNMSAPSVEVRGINSQRINSHLMPSGDFWASIFSKSAATICPQDFTNSRVDSGLHSPRLPAADILRLSLNRDLKKLCCYRLFTAIQGSLTPSASQ